MSTGYWRSRLARFWRREIAHWRPSGLFNWHYLRPRLPPLPAWHRALWWRSRNRLPWVLWLPLELLRLLHWQGLGAGRALRLADAANAARVFAAEGIAPAAQFERLAYWARRWVIAPEYGHDLGLYRKGVDGLAFLYPHEQQAYHRLMNARRGVGKADYRLVQDKYRLAERLSAAGVPVVATRECMQGGLADLESALAEQPAVFCKSRFGSRGEGAFRVQRSRQGGLQGQLLSGEALPSESDVRAAWQALAGRGEVLIQPYLHNHPQLQNLAGGDGPVTVRLITRMHGDVAEAWASLLYVQAPGDSADRSYWLLKIDLATGRLSDAFGHWQETAIESLVVPYWPAIVSHSLQSQSALPRLWAIAWDWIVTPDGPVLLEGNTGWDMSPLQTLGVDFAAVYREAGPIRAG